MNMRERVRDRESFLKKVSEKTNVSKEDIFSLAQNLQTKNLKKEEDIRAFIGQIADVTNTSISEAKMDKLVDVIKNNKMPKDIEKMMK
jgi:hypothetical protein